uniref:Phospholipid-transporting ATPase DNF1 n=1 Tax=Lygus hesperus TaxID=30085 RepID=A0A0A9XSA3_LYGHE
MLPLQINNTAIDHTFVQVRLLAFASSLRRKAHVPVSPVSPIIQVEQNNSHDSNYKAVGNTRDSELVTSPKQTKNKYNINSTDNRREDDRIQYNNSSLPIQSAAIGHLSSANVHANKPHQAQHHHQQHQLEQ